MAVIGDKLGNTGYEVKSDGSMTTPAIQVWGYTTLGSVGTLPTADSTYWRKVIILSVSGQADKLYVCLKNADGTFTWRQVTLS